MNIKNIKTIIAYLSSVRIMQLSRGLDPHYSSPVPALLSANHFHALTPNIGWVVPLALSIKFYFILFLKLRATYLLTDFSLCLTKPCSIPFSVCPALLSKHHAFIVTNFNKAYSLDWKRTCFKPQVSTEEKKPFEGSRLW